MTHTCALHMYSVHQIYSVLITQFDAVITLLYRGATQSALHFPKWLSTDPALQSLCSLLLGLLESHTWSHLTGKAEAKYT